MTMTPRVRTAVLVLLVAGAAAALIAYERRGRSESLSQPLGISVT